jgi:hypothetical protein
MEKNPPEMENILVRTNFHVSEHDRRLLREIGHGNMASGLRKLLEDYRQARQVQKSTDDGVYVHLQQFGISSDGVSLDDLEDLDQE